MENVQTPVNLDKYKMKNDRFHSTISDTKKNNAKTQPKNDHEQNVDTEIVQLW